MRRIFLSYSRDDKLYTERIAALLSKAFDDVWYDMKNIRAGVNWWSQIEKHISTCDHFIFLMSEASVHSEYCIRELEEAKRLQKHIVPVRIRRSVTIPVQLSFLSELQQIDMLDEPSAEGISEVFASIIRYDGGLAGITNTLEDHNSLKQEMLVWLHDLVKYDIYHETLHKIHDAPYKILTWDKREVKNVRCYVKDIQWQYPVNDSKSNIIGHIDLFAKATYEATFVSEYPLGGFQANFCFTVAPQVDSVEKIISEIQEFRTHLNNAGIWDLCFVIVTNDERFAEIFENHRIEVVKYRPNDQEKRKKI